MSTDPKETFDRPREPTPEPSAAASQWFKGNLVSIGSAAVFAVYAAGFERTRAAEAKFKNEAAGRRAAAPIRTTGEIGAPRPRTPDESVATAPVHQSAPSAHTTPSKAQPPAKSAPAPEPRTPVEKPVVAAPVAIAPPASAAPAPARDSVPAPVAKPVEASVTPAAAPPVAPATPAAPTATAADTAVKELVRKDGMYSGWGTSRHGDIQATVQIKNGKIVLATITECLTRYSCSWIAPLPPQVLSRQSADVDIVSGATESTNAFYYAVIEALNKAK